MGINNPWNYCDTNPPEEYVRVEIKSRDKRRYVGYRFKNKYYETIGNYVIKNPYMWRYIPVGSILWEDIKEKICNLSMGNEEVAYGINSGE